MTGTTRSHTGTESDSDTPEAGDGKSYARIGYLLPVLVFLVVGIGLAIGLTRDPSTLPSALIDKPVPTFELPPLAGMDKPGLSSTDLTGKVQLVNVFASWCGPCRVEHPILMKLAKDGVPIQALNYKDEPSDAGQFLAALGNPYERIGVDKNGRTGIEWGVYGVPETFVIDAEGKIRHKHVGPIQARDVDALMKIIEDLRP
ncbi:MAG: DsbE family thiol:disulfide interchange protein [Alphaproteobacteria bacterium]